MDLPQGCRSLTDMAESIFRSLCDADSEGIWKGEVLHIQSFMDKVSEYVNSNGNVNSYGVGLTYYGVLPALKIKL